MKCVVQRVRAARVEVDGVVRGEIGPGLVALVGVEVGDGPREAAWLGEKLAHLRVFEDGEGKMNRSVLGAGGGVLAVPNFTLAGDAAKGRRPSFGGAMKPEQAGVLFDAVVRALRGAGVRVETGVFRAAMLVTLTNDGPVTLVLQSPSLPGDSGQG